MTKQMKMLFYGLVVLVGILAASTTFFVAKSRQGGSSTQVAKSSKPEVSSTGEGETKTPTPQVSTAVTRPATEKPSHPAKTYTIQGRDTLLGIAQKQGTTLAELADANGISDTDKIQAGQVLIIPENGQVEFILDNTKSTSLQTGVDQGKTPWRLNPDETARADASGAYGLKISDVYTVKDRSDEGKATVTASSENGNLVISLIQPVTKGQKGIWAIQSIKKV